MNSLAYRGQAYLIMMNKKEILKKVGGILTELNEQYEYLSKSPDNLNELELELFSANANFLSDHLSILVKLNESSKKSTDTTEPAPQQLGNQETTDAHSPIKEGKQEESVSSGWKFELEKEPEATFEFERKQTDKLFDRPLTDEEKKVIDEKTKLKAAGKEEVADSDFKEPENSVKEETEPQKDAEDVHVKEVVISERTIAVPVEQIAVETPVPTVNDLLSKNLSQQTVSSQLNFRQNKDLKGMISLNDKLLFVRDLFNGYSLAYSEALELLNRFDSFEAADNFLKQNYAQKNNWAEKQEVTDKFYEILNRRFAK